MGIIWLFLFNLTYLVWISNPWNRERFSPSGIVNLDCAIGPQHLVNDAISQRITSLHIFLLCDRGFFSFVFSVWPGFVLLFKSGLILLWLNILKICPCFLSTKIPVEHWPYCTITERPFKILSISSSSHLMEKVQG